MKPGKLYKGARIVGDDGFVMAKITHKCNIESNKKLMEMVGASGDVLTRNGAPKDWIDERTLQKVFIKYLKEFCSNSFGVAISALRPVGDDDWAHKVAIYICFRERKDLFKFSMRFGAKRIRWWRSNLSFTIIGTEDETYEKRHAGDKWNKEDPHGYLRP